MSTVAVYLTVLILSTGLSEGQFDQDDSSLGESPSETNNFPFPHQSPLLVTIRSMRRPIARGNRITRLPLPMDVPPTNPLVPFTTPEDLETLSTQDVEPVFSISQTLFPAAPSPTPTNPLHESLQSLLTSAGDKELTEDDFHLPQTLPPNNESTTDEVTVNNASQAEQTSTDINLPTTVDKSSNEPKLIFSITVPLHPPSQTTAEETSNGTASNTTPSDLPSATQSPSTTTEHLPTDSNSQVSSSSSQDEALTNPSPTIQLESLPDNNQKTEENEISPNVFLQNSNGALSHDTELSFTELLPRVSSLVDHWCLDCLCQASSNCENVGCTEGVCGSYQLSLLYWIDAEKPDEANGFEACALNKTCSQIAIQTIMKKYHRDCNSDGIVDCYDFALIHKAGPDNCGAQWPLDTLYWTRFTECQVELEAVKPFNVQSGTTQASISRQDPPTTPPSILRPQPLGGSFPFAQEARPPLKPQLPQLTTQQPLVPSIPPLKPTSQPGLPASQRPEQQPEPQGSESPTQGPGLPSEEQPQEIQEVSTQFQGEEPLFEEQGFNTQQSAIGTPSQRPQLVQQGANGQSIERQRPNQTPTDNNFIDTICFDCLCYASSNCENVGCGAACGPYQISFGYWTDAGRPGFRNGFEACALNRTCAEQTIINYMAKYRRDCNGDGVIDCFDYALIHKAGPLNCRAEWPLQTPYWSIFTECHFELTAEASQGVQTTINPALPQNPQPQQPGPQPDKPNQQGPQPGRPNQQGPQPERPNQQGPQPGRPNQQGPQPGRPNQQGPQPGRPNQQGPQPGRPNQQGPQPGRPNQQGPQPGRPNQQGPQPGRPNQQGPGKPGHQSPESTKPQTVLIPQQNHTIERVCLDCLCYAMTECKNIGCQGDVCGPYKITRAYWTDSGKPGKVNSDLPQAFEVCALDQDCSEHAVQGYMNKFAKDCNNDGIIDCLDFARIHIAGPYACDGKWVDTTFLNRKFLKCYEESTNGVSGQGRLQFAHAFDYPGDEGVSPHLPLPPGWRKPPVQSWRVPPPPNFGSYTSRSNTHFQGNTQGDLRNQHGSFHNRAQGTNSRTFQGSFANGQSQPPFQTAASQQSQFFNRSSSSSSSQESSSEFHQQSSSGNQFQNTQGFQQPPPPPSPRPNFQSNFQSSQDHKMNWNANGQGGFYGSHQSQGSNWDNSGGRPVQTAWNNGNHNQQQHNQGNHWHHTNFEHQHWNHRQPPFPRFKPRPPFRMPPWNRKPIPPWRPPVPPHQSNWDNNHFKHETFQTSQQNFENEDTGYKNVIANNGHPPYPPYPAFPPHPQHPYGPPEVPVPNPQPEQPVPQQPPPEIPLEIPPQPSPQTPPQTPPQSVADKTNFKNETRESFYNKTSFSHEEFESKTESESSNQAAANAPPQPTAPQASAPKDMKTQTRELSYNKTSSKHEEHESKFEKVSSSEQGTEAVASPTNNVPAPPVSPPSTQPSSDQPGYNKESNAETQASTSTAAAISVSEQSTTAASTTAAQSSATETQATESTTAKKTETEETAVENKTTSEQKKETNFEKTEKIKETEEESFDESKTGTKKKDIEIEKTESNSTKEESKLEQESSASQKKEEQEEKTTTAATTTTEATTKTAAVSKEAETTAFKNESHKLSFENSSTSMSQSSSKFKEESSAASADSSASQASASQASASEAGASGASASEAGASGASGRSAGESMAAASSILVPVHQMPPWILGSKRASNINSFDPIPLVKIDRSCLDCICQASTGCQPVDCEGPFCGPYSITSAFWERAGKPGIHWGETTQEGHYNCAMDMSCSELTIRRFMGKFQRDCNGDQVIDCLDFARLHQAGDSQCDARWIDTTPFWSKFQQCRQKQEPTVSAQVS